MWLIIKTENSDQVLNLDCKCLRVFKPAVLVYLIPLKNLSK